MLNWPLDLFSGNVAPDETLERGKATGSRKYIAGAHYYIAMKHLLDGNRESAKYHFWRFNGYPLSLFRTRDFAGDGGIGVNPYQKSKKCKRPRAGTLGRVR